MKNLFDMTGQCYELPDEVAASSLRPIAQTLLFDKDGTSYEAGSLDLSQYRVAGAGEEGRLALLNPAASDAGESQPRLCGPIVTWCDRGFCLT